MHAFSTYRIQFRPEFGFDAAAAIIPYLASLGISHIYASPIFKPRAGSTHGYDVVDPSQLNPELGGEEAFARLSSVLREHGMGLLLDIVPNHMAASSENPWWTDLLAHGVASSYSRHFDVDWTSLPGGRRPVRVLLPILGKPYGEALEEGEIRLELSEGRLVVRYWEHRLPVAPDSLGPVLQRVIQIAGESAGCRRELDAICSEIWQARERKGSGAALAQKWSERLLRLHENDPKFAGALERAVIETNGREREPESYDALDDLLEDQWYRLSYWRTAGEAINYRRFFDVTDLVGVRVEDERVMRARHERAIELMNEGAVSGFRIDHIDGLFDPAEYLRRLRRMSGADWILVEKILARNEELPSGWECAGTTGYDFLARVNEVFTDPAGLEHLRDVWSDFTSDERDFDEVVRDSKRKIIASLFAGEMRALAHDLAALASHDRNARDFLPGDIEDALLETTAALDVYRTYVTPDEVPDASREVVERAITTARDHASGDLDPRIFEFIRRVLLLDPPRYLSGRRDEWAAFVMKWQQFTGRAMAKGVEDTTFYVYAPLLALNEVGGEPDLAADADPLVSFHQFMMRRGHQTMNALATHDTKRGEDARARLLTLSELSAPFERRLREWARLNYPRKTSVRGRLAPSRAEESMIYQTLLGVWPSQGEQDEVLRERLDGWVEKSLREAKTNTSWIEVDEEYEAAVKSWLRSSLHDSRFADSLSGFAGRLAWYGALNSLSQTLVRCTAPGVPDTYQGTEGWDLSLVDPDNRRPVDYGLRREWMQQLPVDVADGWRDGRVKMHVLRTALAARRDHPEIFSRGEYQPLEVSGPGSRHIIAFARRSAHACSITIVPRLLTRLVAPGELPTGALWEETRIEAPDDASGSWRNLIAGDQVQAVDEGAGFMSFRAADVLGKWPLALLIGRSRTNRE